MKQTAFAVAAFAAFLLFSGTGLAHNVTVFAFVDGGEIQIECGFSRSRKVKNGKIVITDPVTGDTVHEGVTDDQGIYRYRPSDAVLAAGHGLNIRLQAGEGHQDDWEVTPEELRALSGAGQPVSVAVAESGKTHEEDARKGTENPGGSRLATDAAAIEAIVSRVLDAKLSPINQALARQQNDEPGLRDILGGLGWILGLLGLAAYMKYRHSK